MTKRTILWVLAFIALFISYYSNGLGIVPDEWYKRSEKLSEALVLNRMMLSKESGISCHHGFLMAQHDGRFENVEANFIAGKHTPMLSPYLKQIGLQGTVYSLLYNTTPLPSSAFLHLCHAITAAAILIVLLMIVLWVHLELGSIAAVFTFLAVFFAPRLIMIANNLYWVYWVMFLPMVVVLWGLRKADKTDTRSIHATGICALIAVFLKSASGYEYISTVLVAMATPVVYYAVSRRWDAKRFLTRFAWIGLYGVTGFVLCVLVHGYIRGLTNETSWLRGISGIINDASRRTYGNPADFAVMYRHSLEVSLPTVLKAHLLNYSSIFILALAVLTYINRLRIKRDDRLRALCLTSWFSLMAPLSWFVLAKGHSYDQQFLSFIIWYLPFIPVTACFWGYAMRDRLMATNDKTQKRSIAAIASAVIPYAVCLLVFTIIPYGRYIPASVRYPLARTILQIKGSHHANRFTLAIAQGEPGYPDGLSDDRRSVRFAGAINDAILPHVNAVMFNRGGVIKIIQRSIDTPNQITIVKLEKPVPIDANTRQTQVYLNN